MCKKGFASPDLAAFVPFIKHALPIRKSVCTVQFLGWHWTAASACPPALWHQVAFIWITLCMPPFGWHAARWMSIVNVGNRLQADALVVKLIYKMDFHAHQLQQKSSAGEGTCRGRVTWGVMSWQRCSHVPSSYMDINELQISLLGNPYCMLHCYYALYVITYGHPWHLPILEIQHIHVYCTLVCCIYIYTDIHSH